MTVTELLERGWACESAGDLDGAAVAYREADELQDAEGALLLGLVFKRRGDLAAAADAFRRAEERGHPEAGSSLGNLLWGTGDIAGAREAYERSVTAGSSAAHLNLGLMLAQEGAADDALPHLRAAEETGPDPAAASWAIGKLLEDREDFDGAASAYRRGAEGGNVDAAYGLGVVLERLGDRDGARTAMQRARDLGHEGAGKVLEAMDREAIPTTVQAAVEATQLSPLTEPQDGEPVIPPLAPGEERLLNTVHRADGNRNEIYLVHRRPSDDQVTGAGEPINFVAIIRSTDADPNDSSPQWAWQRGPTERSIYIAIAEANVNAPPPPGASATTHPDVQWFADRIREQRGGVPSENETASKWVHLYVAACGEVLNTANTCLEVANRAIGARNMAAKRPQHEISIQHFTQFAEEAEREFGPIYQAFASACESARDAAKELLSSKSDPLFAEMLLATTIEDSVLDNVATAKGILGAKFGPTPAAFIEGVNEANALMQNPPDEGNIYRRPAPAPSDERTCPWCAETIKAAAVICRFCGREVELVPNVG